MVRIDDFNEERPCLYKGEQYLVRDNGAVLRKSVDGKRARALDDQWTFGKLNTKTGYLEIASVRIHRIVAVAFHGEPPTSEHIVDHIDTNRQNNRPNNLRWITRLENVVLNEVTRKRIEYRTGVSIYEFLANPTKYRGAFDDPDFSWMRRVTEAEARACLENVRRWSETKIQTNSTGGKIGGWIYQSRREGGESGTVVAPQYFFESKSNIIDSLTLLAKQKNWKTPQLFACCPEMVEGDPIGCYIKRMSEGVVFATSQYGESRIVKYTLFDNQVLVITETPSSIKPFGLLKITYENDYFLHESLGAFLTEDGVEKQFALAQGLEWLGGDTIDDYC